MNRPPSALDPERGRIGTLLARVESGEITDAEREELALYVAEDPGLRAQIDAAQTRGALGHGWMERVRQDEMLLARDSAPQVRLERGIGLALLVLGYPMMMLTGVLGAAAFLAGSIILIYSFVRVRMGPGGRDPYDDVQR